MMYNLFIKTTFVICFFLIVSCCGQVYTVAKLDAVTKKYKDQGNTKDALDFNLEVLRQFKATSNKTGMITAYINIGNILCTINKYEKSLYYLDKANEQMSGSEDPILYARLYNEYGRNYSALGLYEQSDEFLNKALRFAEKISDQKTKNYFFYFSYAWKLVNFDEQNQTDSVYVMQKKCLKLSSEPLVYVKVAERYIKRNINIDSAAYYLNKGMENVNKYSVHQKQMVLVGFGDMYTLKKNYKKALNYYYQALTISKKMDRKTDMREMYRTISKTYSMLNDTVNAAVNLEKYTVLNDSLSNSEKKAMQALVESLIDTKETEVVKKENKFYILISIIISFFVISIYFIRKNYLIKKQKMDELIDMKVSETDVLKRKINESFNNVITLAKNKDPFFLVRFKEVYPEFCARLAEENPDLTEHDIKISAYMRLNLNNKEICNYEDISVRSIETKKYRLKKKLNLSVNEDLGRWILEL